MPTWTKQQLQEYEARRIHHIGSTRLCPAKLKQDTREPLECVAPGETKGRKGITARFRITFSIFRCRPLDWDNHSTKQLQDCLVACGFIPDDNWKVLEGCCRSEKAVWKGAERTEITITRLT